MREKTHGLRLLPLTFVVTVGWTCLVAALMWFNWQWVGASVIEIARVEARASIEKDILYRAWNAKHGGVYVPITEDTQPNPYLKVPQRDVTTTAGVQLTLINPAYMTRQVHELQADGENIHVRLTSLKPLNPKNAADEWERQALQSFEAGATEAEALETTDGEEYLRLMRPFIVKEECLKCHAAQGYKVGDIRGGISAAAPLSAYAGVKQKSIQAVYFGYASIWLAGLLGIALASRTLKRRVEKEETQAANYRSILQTSMEGFWQVDARGRIVETNETYCRMSGYAREELLQMNINDLDAVESQEDTQRHIQTVLEKGADLFESIHRRKDGALYAVEINVRKLDRENIAVFLRDVSARKQTEAALRDSENRYRALFDQMLDAFALHEIICDESGRPVDYRFLAVNSAFEEMTGLKAQDILGKTAREILPNLEDFWFERYGQVALSGNPDEFEEFSTSLNRYYEVRAFRTAPMQFAVIFHDVSERKYTENITMAHMRIVEIATARSLDDLLQTVLDEAEALTGSRIGFYHFVDDDQNALTLQNWSTRTMNEFCHADGKGSHYPINKAGVWVECVYAKQPVVHNDYAALPPTRRKGLPEGHAEVIRELTVPVMRGEKVIAILGVGNKLSDYTQKDVDIVQQLADLVMEIVERKRAEEALQENKTLLQQAQRVAQLGYYQLDTTSGVWQSSDILDGIFGIEPDYPKTVEGWVNIVHPEEQARMAAYFANEVLGKKQDFDMEYRIVRQNDGQTRWVHGLGKLAFNKLGETIRMVGTIQDVTQRKEDEQKILAKSQELEALFKISSNLRAAQSAQDMLPLALEQLTEVFHSDANAIILLDADRQNFTYALGSGRLAANTGSQFPVEKSISERVMQTLQTYFTEDFSHDPLRTPNIRSTENLGAALFAPLQSEKEFLGVLLCARDKNSPHGNYGESEMRLLQAIGEMVGNALRRVNLFEDALLRLERVQALRAIDATINASMDAALTLRVLVNETISLLKADAVAALLYNPVTRMLEQVAAQGFQRKSSRAGSSIINYGCAYQVITERRNVYIPQLDQAQDPKYRILAEAEGFTCAYLAPMVSKGQVCGILEVYHRGETTHNQEWLDFLEALGGQAAIAVNNAQLFANLERTNMELSLAYEATIEGWSRALELRDKETEGHTLRVTNWAVQLAELAGLNQFEILSLKRGALLHDIGKMGVPDHILNKEGALTPEEWEVMRQHPQHAYNMLAPIAFLRSSIDIPYCHHEKWDGSGYPRGLRGEQIPLPARLFAIIDVWDALTSDRPYRKAWSAEKTAEYIRAQAGKHFDPQVAALFLQRLDEFQRT